MSGVSGKIVTFPKEMSMEQSPLCLAHPPEDRLYGHLVSTTSSCGEFVLFCRAAESRLAACLSVVGRRNSGTRSVLVGQTLRRLPSSVEHQRLRLWTWETSCAKAVQFSEGDAVTSAVMASSVDHVWNDRGRKDAADRVQASSAASLAGSCSKEKKLFEEEEVAFHADWTFKRVRGHFLASKEFMLLLLLLLFVEEFVVVTWWWCCCLWRR